MPLPDTSPSPAAGSPALGGATPLAAVPGAPPIAPLTLPPRTVMPPSPQEAFRSGTQLLRQGKTEQAIMELEFAAEQGVPGAIWKLGRMYADGDAEQGDTEQSSASDDVRCPHSTRSRLPRRDGSPRHRAPIPPAGRISTNILR